MATAGTVVFGGSFVGLLLLPVDFPYWGFALLIAANGIGSGMFAAPNTSSIMSSVPARLRGAASGMRATFQNSGTALSIGIFFSLMIAGLTGTLSTTLTSGLQQHGVAQSVAHHVGSLPPVSSLFAALLGVNPIQHLLAPSGALSTLSASSRQVLTGHTFFPQLISAPFHHGLGWSSPSPPVSRSLPGWPRCCGAGAPPMLLTHHPSCPPRHREMSPTR